MITQKSKPNKDKLKIQDLKISYKGNTPDQAQQKITAASTLPQVYYYGTELPAQHIKKLTLDNNKFLPICYVCFRDVYGIFHDIGFPSDNAKLTIVMPSNNNNLANVFMDFKITNFEVEIAESATLRKIHIWGICNVEGLLISKYESFAKKTTWDVLKTLSQDAGLGFMSNIDSTNDSQTWANPGFTRTDFIMDTTHKSFAGDSSYMWSFVDFYYNLNYVDVEKAMTEDIKDVKWVVNSSFNNTVNQTDNQKPNYSQPFLTNDDTMMTTNLYFTGERILNKSTKTSLKRGYIRNVHFYDIDGNWGSKAGKYNSYGLDTITTPGAESTSVILKGEPGNNDFYKQNKKNYWLGKIDTINSYPDYLYAKLQNSENLYDLQKIAMQIILPNPNFNIKRFEKIKLTFSNKTVGARSSIKNAKLNGEWLCTGISYEWNGKAMYQVVNIVKRELTVDDL